MSYAASLLTFVREFTEQGSTKFYEMLGNEPHLQTHVKTFRRPSIKIGEQKTARFGTVFNSTTLCDMPKIGAEFFPPAVKTGYDYGANDNIRQ